MRISFSETFEATTDQIFALMTDETFQRSKADRLNAIEFGMTVQEDISSVTVTTRRKFETTQMPEFIKPMLNPTMTVIEIERWPVNPQAGGLRTGAFEIDAEGAPIRLAGMVSLAPTEKGATVTFEGNLTSTVPLFRRKVEEAASHSILETMRTEAMLLRDTLAA